jgi:MYXO-CTERM domain-containing protein
MKSPICPRRPRSQGERWFLATAAAVMLQTQLVPATQAAVVSTSLSGSTVSFGEFYFGQTVITPAGGPWDHLTFNFYADVPPTTPKAFGNLYLLTLKYSGTPDDLGSSTPGLLGVSTGISGGRYVFGTAVALQPGTTYYVYADARRQISGQASGPGPNFFSTSQGSATFTEFAASTNFALEGELVVVPEPKQATLVGALLGVGALAWRRRRSV